MRIHLAVLTAALALAPLAAHAQPLGWQVLPDGNVTYTAEYTTSGSFTCGSPGFLPVGATCSASGNAITIGNGGAFLTLAFNGIASQRITAANYESRPVTLGSITKTFGGSGPFTFPASLNPNVLGFTFDLTINGSARRFGYRFDGSATELPVNCCEYFPAPNYGFGTAPPPPPYRGVSVLFERVGGLTIRTTDTAPLGVTAVVGIIPEPATVALVGLGALAVGLYGARCRPNG